MGVIFHLPTVECVSLVETLNALRSQGIRVLAAHPEPRGRTIVSADFSRDAI